MLVKFWATASDQRRACVRLATKLAETAETGEDSVHFNVASNILKVAIDGASERLEADVQRAGAASVPFTVLAGMVHVLPYFGNKAVEIGFSQGKMQVDATVCYDRRILLSRSIPSNAGVRP